MEWNNDKLSIGNFETTSETDVSPWPALVHMTANVYLFISFFCIGKKTLMYSPCPSVRESIFSRTMRHTEPNLSASIHKLEKIQIWFIYGFVDEFGMRNGIECSLEVYVTYNKWFVIWKWKSPVLNIRDSRRLVEVEWRFMNPCWLFEISLSFSRKLTRLNVIRDSRILQQVQVRAIGL